jgi:hypothetical protein
VFAIMFPVPVTPGIAVINEVQHLPLFRPSSMKRICGTYQGNKMATTLLMSEHNRFLQFRAIEAK